MRALDGKIDPDVFEECAADLLSEVYPSIAHVPGGSDDGIDGLAISADGHKQFLVATTSEDLEKNLRKNLRSHRKAGNVGSPIFGTSRVVTTGRRKKLEAIATEQGYVLHAVFQRSWFARKLLGNARWRKALLGLSGDPNALSSVPLGAREGLKGELVGRDRELARLREGHHDMVVAGQPGSGKTALLHDLIGDGGRFVVGTDFGQIANDIREMAPPILLVDDVIDGTPFDTTFLARLRQLRTEIGADFRIVAACWPSERARAADVLGAGPDRTIVLGALSRDRIVELIGAVGLKSPTYLVRLVVDQAEGLAGLARLLAEAILSGKVRDVYSGEMLAERAYRTVDALVGKEARYPLAVLALSGKAGLPTERAAQLLGMAIPEYAASLRGLATGGVVRECNEYSSSMAVFPEMLRGIIVRDVFFRDPGFLSYQRVLEAVSNEADVVKVLIGAHARGARVPDLTDRLIRLDRGDLWRRYASVGANEAAFVLKHAQEALRYAAVPALRHGPELVLPKLLEAALGDQRANATDDPPLRIIKAWVEDIPPWRGDFVAARQAVLDAVVAWDRSGPDRGAVALQAVAIALSPDVHRAESDPGTGRTLTITDGILRPRDLKRLLQLWPAALQIVRELAVTPWEPIFDLLHRWRHPLPYINETAGSEKARNTFVRRVVTDLAEITRASSGIQQRLGQQAASMGFVLANLVVDHDYTLLFPQADFDFTATDRFGRLVEQFVDRHREMTAAKCAALLASFEREAALAPHLGPRLTSVACEVLARRTSEPIEWTRAFIAAGCPRDCVEPFLQKAIEDRADGVEALLADCLAQPAYELSAVTRILRSQAPSNELLGEALNRATDHVSAVGMLCSSPSIPSSTLSFLLTHRSAAVRSAVVEGCWYRLHAAPEDAEVTRAWTDAVLGMRHGYVLKEILQMDLFLAERWILLRLDGPNGANVDFDEERVMQEIAPRLGLDARKRLVAAVKEGHPMQRETLLAVIGDDADSCRLLFARKDLRHAHDNMLEGPPDAAWRMRAKAAIDAGYEPHDIAQVSFHGVNHIKGSKAEHWRTRVKAFETLLMRERDQALQVALREGARLAAELVAQAVEREQHEEVFGDS